MNIGDRVNVNDEYYSQKPNDDVDWSNSVITNYHGPKVSWPYVITASDGITIGYFDEFELTKI